MQAPGILGRDFPSPREMGSKEQSSSPSLGPGSERAGPWLAMKARGQGPQGWGHSGEQG